MLQSFHFSANNRRWQALVESNRNPHHKSILNLTRGIIFFGTPHQGLRTYGLEEMVDADSGGQRRNLIMQLKEGSEFLENQKEDLIRIWEGFKRKVVNFYETMKTPLVRMVNNACPVSSILIEMLLTSSSLSQTDL
jgi:hypothetical protein